LQVETLRAKVSQKDMFIAELLDRIAIVECEVRATFSMEQNVNFAFPSPSPISVTWS